LACPAEAGPGSKDFVKRADSGAIFSIPGSPTDRKGAGGQIFHLPASCFGAMMSFPLLPVMMG